MKFCSYYKIIMRLLQRIINYIRSIIINYTILLFLIFFRDKDKKTNLVEYSAFVTARITASFSW